MISMDFEAGQITAKNGCTYRLRPAEPADASVLLELLRITAEQTRFLIREPDEITMTEQQERDFIQEKRDAANEALLVIESDGRIWGLCSLSSFGPFRRYAHRCSVAIALHRDVWGQGLGRRMMKALLMAAKEAGYEQAELDVMADNRRAVALYESLGFQKYGILPRNMKYEDGTYADSVWMMKEIR